MGDIALFSVVSFYLLSSDGDARRGVIFVLGLGRYQTEISHIMSMRRLKLPSMRALFSTGIAHSAKTKLQFLD